MKTLYIKAEDIDLQLFADANASTPSSSTPTRAQMNGTFTPDLADSLKTYYEKELLKNAYPDLVHDQFGEKKIIPAGFNGTIEFRKFDKFGKITTALLEGVTPAPQTMKMGKITTSVHQYGGYVIVTDWMDLNAFDDQILGATDLLGHQGGLSMDTVVRDVLQSGNNVMYADKITNGVESKVSSRAALTKDCKLTPKVILKAATRLRANNIKPLADGCYVMIIHPYVRLDIMLDPKFEEWNKYTTPDKMFRGELGRIDNVRFVVSTEAKIYYDTADECAANTAVFGNLMIGAGAYGVTEVDGSSMQIIVKQVGSAGVDDALNQRGSIGWKCGRGAVILDQLAMVRIESCASTDDVKAAN